MSESADETQNTEEVPEQPTEPEVAVDFTDDDVWEGCGYSWDHTEVITFQDDELTQWYCDECGAEGWEDHPPKEVTSQDNHKEEK